MKQVIAATLVVIALLIVVRLITEPPLRTPSTIHTVADFS